MALAKIIFIFSIFWAKALFKFIFCHPLAKANGNIYLKINATLHRKKHYIRALI